MKQSGIIPRYSYLVVAAALLLIIHFYTPPRGGLWLKELFDSAHVLAFGLIALSVFASLPASISLGARAATALGISVFLGVASEAAQIPVARDASWHDLISDWCGSAAFLGLAVAISAPTTVTFRVRSALILLSLLLLGWALRQITLTALAYLERYRQLPVLVHFESGFTDTFMRRQNVHVARTNADPAAVRVELLDAPWPGLVFHEPWPDWRDFGAVVVDLEISGDTVFNLNVRINDRQHVDNGQAYTDRYNGQFQLSPGSHELRIDLDDVMAAPRDRDMDMSQVDGIILFGRKEDAGRTFTLRQIRLVN